MKNIFLSIFFIVAFANNLFAQNPLVKQWDKRFGGIAEDYLLSFQQTSDGGFILGGESKSGIGGDKTQPSWGGYDYWAIKIDSLGNKQWDKRYGGTSDDWFMTLQQTNDGGYIIGGYSASGISGDKTQTAWGGTDYWIVKIDAIGNKQWDRRFGGLDNDYFTSLEQTSDGGYILGGFTGSPISGDKTQPNWGTGPTRDYWIVKIDSLGNKQWDKRFGGTYDDHLQSIHQTTDGGYILGGSSPSGNNGDKTQPAWGWNSGDYWVVKIDSLGIKQWDKRFGGTNDDWFATIKQTNDGGYIIGGYSSSGINGDKTQGSWGFEDYWIVKIDSIGTKQWDKRFGGLSHELFFYSTISLTNDDGYLLTGTSASAISGDKTENNLGPKQMWILKIDSVGIKIWDKTIFNTGQDATGHGIQTKDGCYAITNYTTAGIGGYKSQNSQGSYDYWIIKFCDTTSASAPYAYLSVSDNSFCEKNCINFFDLSTNNPTSWQWFFPGAQPDTSTFQNPTNICYNTYGSFDVTLIACNAAGCDTLVLHNFINAYPNPVDSIWGLNDTLFSLPAYSYQWYEVTSGLISGATNQFYIPTQLGSYFCVVSDSIGCVATSNTVGLTPSPSPKGEWSLAIAPNPFSDEINISLFNNQASEFILYDITSRKLLQQEFINSISLNTEMLAKGVYICELRNKNEIICKRKIVKNSQ